MTNIKINVLSHKAFDNTMRDFNINDTNVDNKTDLAFISIIGTEECLKYYLHEEDTKHYFNNEHTNVLNLDFDDIGDDIEYDGHTFKTMTMKQAERAVDFIEDMINKGEVNKTFHIHCRSGMSRSRAFAEFIFRTFNDIASINYDDRDKYINLYNQGIFRRLNHAYWKKHKLFCYSHGKDYDKDLI